MGEVIGVLRPAKGIHVQQPSEWLARLRRPAERDPLHEIGQKHLQVGRGARGIAGEGVGRREQRGQVHECPGHPRDQRDALGVPAQEEEGKGGAREVPVGMRGVQPDRPAREPGRALVVPEIRATQRRVRQDVGVIGV
ncbi:MAG: hypothetical protein ACREKG_03815, partial [Candidatus Rokuibacteriota bacterium]